MFITYFSISKSKTLKIGKKGTSSKSKTRKADILTDYKTQLLNLVVLKENIGEGLWYVYTALLIASIVYYNLANVGCVQSVNQIKASHDEYIKTQAETAKKVALNDSVKVAMN